MTRSGKVDASESLLIVDGFSDVPSAFIVQLLAD
jgi:hypothetical protein